MVPKGRTYCYRGNKSSKWQALWQQQEAGRSHPQKQTLSEQIRWGCHSQTRLSDIHLPPSLQHFLPWKYNTTNCRSSLQVPEPMEDILSRNTTKMKSILSQQSHVLSVSTEISFLDAAILYLSEIPSSHISILLSFLLHSSFPTALEATLANQHRSILSWPFTVLHIISRSLSQTPSSFLHPPPYPLHLPLQLPKPRGWANMVAGYISLSTFSLQLIEAHTFPSHFPLPQLFPILCFSSLWLPLTTEYLSLVLLW